MPYGVLANRIGRRPVLFLGILGFTLCDLWIKIVCWFPDQLPLRLIWLALIAQVIGGGTQVSTTMMFVVLADVFTGAEQTQALFYASAAVPISEILAASLRALPMRNNVWVPFLLSSVVAASGLLFVLWLPETLPLCEPSSPGLKLDRPDIQTRMRAAVNEFRKSIVVIRGRGSGSVQLLLFVFLVAYLRRQVMRLPLLFAVQRLHWTIEHFSHSCEGDDQSLPAAGSTPHFVELAPAATLGVVVYALGSGMHLIVRRLITSLVDAHHIGTFVYGHRGCAGNRGAGGGPDAGDGLPLGTAAGRRVVGGAPLLLVGSLYMTAGLAILLGAQWGRKGCLEDS
ncbi:hypothetical protein BO70DRAFT_432438 [Aspergillus heteromorphus CBS 117.55]|uniref:MFS general substrate transporter n=1 Tax=Aspergillus heteromorphus CBS 117.55 TaxID=1448321 RepID=A0A317V636_9EURO|nr:uncharacterized protein BO70DRAFT_432438 [Aspergillus heteromorphus CBS 117.55]PWY69794.1 hypothetical protein BO70DRAFT_432438 [Aspergillus heteromorphus CBS 117.55]